MVQTLKFFMSLIFDNVIPWSCRKPTCAIIHHLLLRCLQANSQLETRNVSKGSEAGRGCDVAVYSVTETCFPLHTPPYRLIAFWLKPGNNAIQTVRSYSDELALQTSSLPSSVCLLPPPPISRIHPSCLRALLSFRIAVMWGEVHRETEKRVFY